MNKPIEKTRLQSLTDELKLEIKSESRLLLAGVEGELFLLNQRELDSNSSAVGWALRAQKGTLEKMLEVFLNMNTERDFEIVALARNIFENLIWLKLFSKNINYGLLFYQELLKSQIKSQHQAISQARTEIEALKKLGIKDDIDFKPIEHLLEEDSEENTKAIRIYIKETMSRVDEEARRSFSVYGHQAIDNGYEYQAYLLEKHVIPQHTERLEKNKMHLNELTTSISSDSNFDMKKEFEDRWNWSKKANEVGLHETYNFIYSYTSRLLHSTPMNIITAKDLTEGEREILVNYIRTAILDVHQEIRKFTYPEKIKAIFIHTGDHNPTNSNGT